MRWCTVKNDANALVHVRLFAGIVQRHEVDVSLHLYAAAVVRNHTLRGRDRALDLKVEVGLAEVHDEITFVVVANKFLIELLPLYFVRVAVTRRGADAGLQQQ
ncbi:hypothetical protein GN244_ATG20520 [Phytophthora infestans]|uniref:Uncharacterized protein n=1 Tax=Phytophthora infestans TaxID=4787 RepID=A0A833SJ82_PHYIN|nr:hypothetical protein GN244_ATG20520 [Phytophthora infestans]